ncbi:DUF7344 domain-containing protein [Natronorubrum aibiense]|uniref:DUF7344 domain-containing protein n=1 Tax=Natronorubrum aibiense TaxID=348826 RepID=A0A5P9P914_9EURY|nr:hypothetical protein [Natronorubrum aibiense]QFU84625.1 hypothetical protein GCU68_19010 [Natronorubrum aibiense]
MVTLDKIFELLENKRRRYALYYLYERDGPVAVGELIEKIDEWEDEQPHHDVPDRFDTLSADLKHTHLPRSSEVEFVQYDPEQGVVQIQGSPQKFDTFVTVARLIEKPDE